MKSEIDLQDTHQEEFLNSIHQTTKTNRVQIQILDHLVYNNIDQGKYQSLTKGVQRVSKRLFKKLVSYFILFSSSYYYLFYLIEVISYSYLLLFIPFPNFDFL